MLPIQGDILIALDLTFFPLFDQNVAAQNTDKTFNLTGTDSNGLTYTGSIRIVDRGETTYSSQPAIQTDASITLSDSNGGVTSGSVSLFGDLTTRAHLADTDNDDGVTCMATQTTPLPETAKINESGALYSETCSDGTAHTESWRLESDASGFAKLIYTATDTDASGNDDGGEESIYIINVLGDVISVTFISTFANGFTLTLSGS